MGLHHKCQGRLESNKPLDKLDKPLDDVLEEPSYVYKLEVRRRHFLIHFVQHNTNKEVRWRGKTHLLEAAEKRTKQRGLKVCLKPSLGD